MLSQQFGKAHGLLSRCGNQRSRGAGTGKLAMKTKTRLFLSLVQMENRAS